MNFLINCMKKYFAYTEWNKILNYLHLFFLTFFKKKTELQENLKFYTWLAISFYQTELL